MMRLGKSLLVGATFLLGVSEANALTLDYSGAGTFNNAPVSQNYGDTSDVNFSYSRLQNNGLWGLSATSNSSTLFYWQPLTFSGDNVIYAPGGSRLELRMQAAPNRLLSNITLNLGSFQSQTRQTTYRIYDLSGNLLQSVVNATVPGTGLAIALTAVTPGIFIQFDNNNRVGVRSVSYTVTAIPIPATLPMLAAAVGTIGAVRRRRKA